MDRKTDITPVLIVIAVLQGFALLGLHKSLEFDVWPAVSPGWLAALYCVALTGPELLLLTLRRERLGMILACTALYTGVVGGLGYYIGIQYTADYRSVGLSGLLPGSIITLAIATFKASLYIQQLAYGGPLEYRTLLRDAWRTLLTLALALLFSAIVGGVLALWAALFVAINIDVFADLFSSEWFLYPVLSLSHGLGIALLRRKSDIFDTIIGILRILARAILVIPCLVSVMFLAALAFTGLTPLWASGGSHLVLWLLALILLFVNVVYQAEPGQHGYALWLHRAVYIAVALLPIYSAISCYGMGLRIVQYGWTIERCWAVLVWGLLTLFSLGYCLQILRYRDGWDRGLGKVNIVAGLVVMLAMLAVNSPLLDFRRIALDSQLARLESGDVPVEAFDFGYLNRELGLPGDQALRALRERYAQSDPQVVMHIDHLLGGATYETREQREQRKEAALMALGLKRDQVPASLWSILKQDLVSELRRQSVASVQLLPLDLDNNGNTDYLLVQHSPTDIDARLYYRVEDQWWSARMQMADSQRRRGVVALPEDIQASDLELVSPRWQEVRVGEVRLEIDRWSMEAVSGTE